MNNNTDTRVVIRAELEATQKVFDDLLDSFSESDLHSKSHNSGWTNGEILVL